MHLIVFVLVLVRCGLFCLFLFFLFCQQNGVGPVFYFGDAICPGKQVGQVIIPVVAVAPGNFKVHSFAVVLQFQRQYGRDGQRRIPVQRAVPDAPVGSSLYIFTTDEMHGIHHPDDLPVRHVLRQVQFVLFHLFEQVCFLQPPFFDHRGSFPQFFGPFFSRFFFLFQFGSCHESAVLQCVTGKMFAGDIVCAEFVVLAAAHIKGIKCRDSFQSFYRSDIGREVHLDDPIVLNVKPGSFCYGFPGIDGFLGGSDV